MPKKYQLYAVVGILVLVGGFLVARAMQGSMVFYYPVKEIVEQNDPAKYTNVRLSGMVKPGTISKDAANETITFTAFDKEDAAFEITVVHTGLEVPDMFKDHAEVVAEGSLNPNGQFESTFMMAKCPSKYEAEYQASGTSPHEEGVGVKGYPDSSSESGYTSY